MTQELEVRIQELGNILNSKKSIVIGKTIETYTVGGDGHSFNDPVETIEHDVTKLVYIYPRKKRKEARKELLRYRKDQDEKIRSIVEEQLAIYRKDRKQNLLGSLKIGLFFAACLGMVASAGLGIKSCSQHEKEKLGSGLVYMIEVNENSLQNAQKRLEAEKNSKKPILLRFWQDQYDYQLKEIEEYKRLMRNDLSNQKIILNEDAYKRAEKYFGTEPWWPKTISQQ